MDNLDHNKKLLLDVVSLLSKTLDLNEGTKLDHGQRVAILAHALATQMNAANPCQLYMAGLLHDIGGMGLKHHVLHHALKNFQDMEAREHAGRGAAILANFRPFITLAQWVGDHHERYDGSGFPAAKSKQEISPEAGILHLADQLDIFIRTSEPVTQESVLNFIERQSGRSVSPAVAAAGRRLFADRGNMSLLTGPATETTAGKDITLHLPGFEEFSTPELLCQLLWLTARVADSKHQGNQDHSVHVAYYSHYIAKALDHPELDPMEVLWTALLHNIGLTAVPREDLQLDYDIRPEISPLYRQHPQIAAELIAAIPSLHHLAPVVAAHHEHYNGTGFPLGLKKEKIPLAAQIIALANTYHWLARSPLAGDKRHEHALHYLEKGKGTLFDPILAETAIEILAIHGQRDISWLHDLPNVYAFFHAQRPDHASPGQTFATESADSGQSLFPRQWQLARISEDLRVLSGAAELSELTGIEECHHLDRVLSGNSLVELQQQLRHPYSGKVLTLTLRSKNNTPLELIFTRQDNGYDLLSRGINTAPLFEQSASVFYRNFISNPEAELLLDHHALIKKVNTAFLHSFQIPQETLLKMTVTELFRPFLSPRKLLELHFFFHAQNTETWSDEFTFITGPGEHLTIQATLYRIHGQEYDNTTSLCRIINISARKNFEQELVRRDAELQASVHNTTGMTGQSFFKTLLYQFMMLTRARIGMISELADNDRRVLPLVFWENHKFWPPPDRFGLHSSPCQLVVKRGEIYFPRRLHEFFPTRFLLQDRDISSYWGLPLRRQDGAIIGILSVYDDKPIVHSRNMQTIARIFQARIAGELARMQTEAILLEKDRQLEIQNNALTRMNQLKSDMIAITSHDLKAPLSAIIGYASLLEQHAASLDPKKTQHYIRRIQDEGHKQLTFINKLLDLYRIESGTIELALEPHRLDILLGSCLSSLREPARAREITFRFTVTGKASSFHIDHLRIGQVLNNLLANAIKFSPDKRVISVGYQQDEHHAVIQIRDQGPGINEQEIDHIFDRYYMGRTDFKIRPQGSGLGLYIVRNIVELHGGTVSAHNLSQGGSCFTVTLPVSINEETHHDPTEHSHH
ncbi:MAG: ATP-binding protein [Deltaproteobacteria bacterium]|nr:ATP-binding protein [Deltaproteobacteria bacterium]